MAQKIYVFKKVTRNSGVLSCEPSLTFYSRVEDAHKDFKNSCDFLLGLGFAYDGDSSDENWFEESAVYRVSTLCVELSVEEEFVI